MNDKLIRIQSELKAPKNQFNKFGNYKYRSCEDILEAVKPLLTKEKLSLTISDEVINVGSYNYIKATVSLSDGTDKVTVSALAREAEVQKGMSDSQITGSSSSYARKYALNGMFLIDDTKDADHQDNRSYVPVAKPVAKPDELTILKNELNDLLEDNGYNNPVKKKSYISKVLQKTTIDSVDDANKVLNELSYEVNNEG